MIIVYYTYYFLKLYTDSLPLAAARDICSFSIELFDCRRYHWTACSNSAWLRTLMRYTLSTHNNTTAFVSVSKDTRIKHKILHLVLCPENRGKINFHSHQRHFESYLSRFGSIIQPSETSNDSSAPHHFHPSTLATKLFISILFQFRFLQSLLSLFLFFWNFPRRHCTPFVWS